MSSPAVAAQDHVSELRRWWHAQPTDLATDDPVVTAPLLADLVGAGLATPPLPGAGATPTRLAVLAAVGELDLTLARLAEAHADAVAICCDLATELPSPGQLWGVWAAEPPNAKVVAERRPDGGWTLTGRKDWCSGAGIYTHALITAHAVDGPRLFAVALDSAGVTVLDGGWGSDALTGADTRSVDLRHVAAVPVGAPNQYVQRPGFWHGAVGVAAVWYGGAVGVARALETASRKKANDMMAVHLGAVDAALGAARASLQAAARQIDEDPTDQARDAAIIARRTRAVVESTVATVIDRVGRALGAAPLAMDRRHARRVADLSLYVRQSHADVDLADLGRRLIEAEEPQW